MELIGYHRVGRTTTRSTSDQAFAERQEWNLLALLLDSRLTVLPLHLNVTTTRRWSDEVSTLGRRNSVATMVERTAAIWQHSRKLLYVNNKKLYPENWHQHCISYNQGKGSGSNWMPKENTAPTDSREKVGSPDPRMESFRTAPLFNKGAFQRQR